MPQDRFFLDIGPAKRYNATVLFIDRALFYALSSVLLSQKPGTRPRSSVVEHFFGKEEVMGPIPIKGSINREHLCFIKREQECSTKSPKKQGAY